MRLPTRILIGSAIVAAAVLVASFGASAPAAASERLETGSAVAPAVDMSARKRHAKKSKQHRATHVRVQRLSKRASEPPNANRPYYRPVPSFFPFAQDRGYF